MNMIEKIQKLFHVDKWWGRLLFLVVFYFFYLFLGYWLWFLLGYYNFISSGIFINQILPSIFFLFFLPIFSFVLVFKIKNLFCLEINRLPLFFINVIIILLNLFLFILASINFFITPDIFI